MKEIIVKNYRKIPAQVQNQGNNQFSVKPIIEDITKCSANFVEVDINGSHVISNPSETEKLIYLDVGTANKPDIVHFTGTNAGIVISHKGILNFTK